jgi:hypothetical protein
MSYNINNRSKKTINIPNNTILSNVNLKMNREIIINESDINEFNSVLCNLKDEIMNLNKKFENIEGSI